MALFETLASIYDETSDMIRPALMRAMLRKALRSPIIFDTVMDWMLSVSHSLEGIQVMSRKFPLSDDHWARMSELYAHVCAEEKVKAIKHAKTQLFMTLATQAFLFDSDHSRHFFSTSLN
eukprot:CAMPEP_0185597464 /NCGR_PEP_ID=MMETSP0434-20130131/81384_1 /TAXON_ID=626734 ORGANISM="Favella taraikaensis, Strain Fe Narragansett Bay" /NCGR_SAMPLE_ID=MMETSP0434 /ASSEMBLY_ACC=CAM_ASM_000379 /LENGTH=119 /DNA_ID=CAMNT_0028226197 /DNA_START=613 /DNA_END=972 /DNA_ORIENTATION=-